MIQCRNASKFAQVELMPFENFTKGKNKSFLLRLFFSKIWSDFKFKIDREFATNCSIAKSTNDWCFSMICFLKVFCQSDVSKSSSKKNFQRFCYSKWSNLWRSNMNPIMIEIDWKILSIPICVYFNVKILLDDRTTVTKFEKEK